MPPRPRLIVSPAHSNHEARPRRRRRAVLLALGAVLVVAAASTGAWVWRHRTASHAQWVEEISPRLRFASGRYAGCQHDSIHVGYTSAWRTAYGPPYVITKVEVDGLEKECVGTTLTVVIEGRHGAVLARARGSAAVRGFTAIVAIAKPPLVSALGHVDVTLTGRVPEGP